MKGRASCPQGALRVRKRRSASRVFVSDFKVGAIFAPTSGMEDSNERASTRLAPALLYGPTCASRHSRHSPNRNQMQRLQPRSRFAHHETANMISDFEIGTWKTHVRRLLHPLTGSTTWVESRGHLRRAERSGMGARISLSSISRAPRAVSKGYPCVSTTLNRTNGVSISPIAAPAPRLNRPSANSRMDVVSFSARRR